MTSETRFSLIEIRGIYAVNPDSHNNPRRIIVLGVSETCECSVYVSFPEHDAVEKAGFLDPKRSFTFYVDGSFAYDLFLNVTPPKRKGRVWIAEFDVSQHPGLWHLKCGPQAQPLDVAAQYSNSSAAPVKARFDKLAIKEGYDIGVLFVHGIGEQRSAETLTQCSTAIQQSINSWFDNNASYLAGRFGQSGIEGLDAGAPICTDWWALDIDYVRRMDLVNAFRKKVDGRSPVEDAKAREDVKAAAMIGKAAFANADLIDVGRNLSEPSNTEIYVEALESDAYLQKSKWLLAESHWAESFRAPEFGNFVRWCLFAGPIAFTYYFGTDVRRSGGRYFRKLHKLVAMAALAAAAELVFLVMLLLALPPVPKIRRALMELQQTLTGVLGDSYIFIKDELQRRAILDRVRRDLRWLLARCRNVVVVAHSQGAAVTYHALHETPEGQSEKLHSVVTLGSGLQTLTALEKSLDSTRTIAAAWLAVTGMWIGALSAWCFTHDEVEFGIAALAIGVVALLTGGINAVNLYSGKKWIPPRMGLVKPWVDYYAAFDPVPFGPVVDEELPNQLYKSKKINNRNSLLTDHTSYWENSEEFVIPLIRHIAAAASYPALAALLPDDDEVMRRAAGSRHLRVLFLQVSRWIALLCSVGLLAAQYRACRQVLLWTVLGIPTMLGFSQSEPASPDATTWLLALMPLVPLFLYAVAVMPVWGSWGRREFAAVLRREAKVAPIFWLALFVSIVTAILHLSIFFAIFTHGKELIISWVLLAILAAIIGKKISAHTLDPLVVH